jgi:hypothetical protein
LNRFGENKVLPPKPPGVSPQMRSLYSQVQRKTGANPARGQVSRPKRATPHLANWRRGRVNVDADISLCHC